MLERKHIEAIRDLINSTFGYKEWPEVFRLVDAALAACDEGANEAENTIERIREAWLPEVLRSVETTVDVRMECDDFNTITRALDGGA